MLLAELLRYLQALQLDTVWLDQHRSLAERYHAKKMVVNSNLSKPPEHIAASVVSPQEETTYSHQKNLPRNEDQELEKKIISLFYLPFYLRHCKRITCLLNTLIMAS